MSAVTDETKERQRSTQSTNMASKNIPVTEEKNRMDLVAQNFLQNYGVMRLCHFEAFSS